jgi:hypothetical protein
MDVKVNTICICMLISTVLLLFPLFVVIDFYQCVMALMSCSILHWFRCQRVRGSKGIPLLWRLQQRSRELSVPVPSWLRGQCFSTKWMQRYHHIANTLSVFYTMYRIRFHHQF